MSTLRDADRKDEDRGPRHLVLPRLPARSARGFSAQGRSRRRPRGRGFARVAVQSGRQSRCRCGLSEKTLLRGQVLVEPAALVEPPQLGVPADRLAVDEDLRDGPAARQLEELLPKVRVVVEIDLVVFDSLAIEQRFRADAIAAPGRRIHLNACHSATKRASRLGIPGPPCPYT